MEVKCCNQKNQKGIGTVSAAKYFPRQNVKNRDVLHGPGLWMSDLSA